VAMRKDPGMLMDDRSDDIESAYRNLIAAKATLFEASEREFEAIESFEGARIKAILERSEEDKSSKDLKEARLLDKIGEYCNTMREAKRDKRMASYDHEIAEARMQFFRDLIEWQKRITAMNASRQINSGNQAEACDKPSENLVKKSHEKTHEKVQKNPSKKTHDKTREKAGSDHKELIQVSRM